MAKEVTGIIKLQIRGGAANPAPPVGPALGAKGVNIMEFCKTSICYSENLPFESNSFDAITLIGNKMYKI